jgi:hypothetical protein
MITQRQEKLLCVGEQFSFPISLGQASGWLSRLSPAATGDWLYHGRAISFPAPDDLEYILILAESTGSFR